MCHIPATLYSEGAFQLFDASCSFWHNSTWHLVYTNLVTPGVWFPDGLLANHLLHWRQSQSLVRQLCLSYSAQTIDEALGLIDTWCASKCRLSQSGGGAASRPALLSRGIGCPLVPCSPYLPLVPQRGRCPKPRSHYQRSGEEDWGCCGPAPPCLSPSACWIRRTLGSTSLVAWC